MECSEKHQFEEIHKTLTERKITLAEIGRDIKDLKELMFKVDIQTTKTNGRVTKLEKCKDALFYSAVGITVGMLTIKLGVLQLVENIL